MAVTKPTTRQGPLVAKVDFVYTDFAGDDVYTAMVDLPPGAIITGGGAAITTLFNSGTTDQFSIGDKVGSAAATNTTYAALSADVTAAPTWIPIVPTGYEYTVRSSVGVVWNPAGTAASAGAGTFIVQYILADRATEVQK